MEEDYVMIPGTGTKKIIRDVKKEIVEVWREFRESQSRIGRKIKRLMEIVYQQV